MAIPLPAMTSIGSATLRVADEKRALSLYRDIIGLKVADKSEGMIALGAGGEPFLFLEIAPHAEPRPRRGLTGLFHVAILLPDRAALSGAILRLAKANIHLGSADHNVSEAIYLYDADGNGLEIYRDRAREEWPWKDGLMQMVNKPLDIEGILAEGSKERSDEHLSIGTRIGHVHLQVGDLKEAEKFYIDVLGFEKTATLPGALFVAADGYHHHIATNIWESRNAPPPPANMAGLSELSIEIPGEDLDGAARRIEGAGVKIENAADSFTFLDPWQTKIRLAPLRKYQIERGVLEL
jgi:catechol 2,3-dioxygenase